MVRPFPGGADLLGKRTAIRNNMIPRHPQGYRSNTMQEKLFNPLMDVIEYDVAPLTRKRVAIGCKVFGAAVLRKDDLSLVLAETNMEAFSPLWHGEVYAIKQFWELQGHPDPKDCIFIATHQPCCMCASAIAWSGFPELFYLFGYENTSKDFHIPHDQKMIRELFHCTSPAEDSSYYTSRPIMGLCDTPEAAARFERIKNLYAELSAVYQAGEKKMVLS